MSASRRVVAGDAILHPIALAALATLILNDQWLKTAWPGFVTGKLSDVAGLIVAPLALVSGVELILWAIRRPWGPSRPVLMASVIGVGAGFVAVQLWTPATDAFRIGLGVLQWPFRAFVAVLDGGAVTGPVPVHAVADAADLIALPALAIAWWVGSRRLGRPQAGRVQSS